MYRIKRSQSKDLNKHLYACVHSGIIHNSQKVKANQVFINGYLNKLNVVNIYNRILSGFKKMKKILKHAKTGMDLYNIMLSELY